jgi:hypothetical protein
MVPIILVFLLALVVIVALPPFRPAGRQLQVLAALLTTAFVRPRTRVVRRAKR